MATYVTAILADVNAASFRSNSQTPELTARSVLPVHNVFPVERVLPVKKEIMFSTQ